MNDAASLVFEREVILFLDTNLKNDIKLKNQAREGYEEKYRKEDI